MPEYHALKGNTPSLDFFKTPHMAAQATCDAQRILGVDAAILFADLLPILEPMGLRLDYLPGIGPKIDNPVRTFDDIDSVSVLPAREQMPYIAEAITLVCSAFAFASTSIEYAVASAFTRIASACFDA